MASAGTFRSGPFAGADNYLGWAEVLLYKRFKFTARGCTGLKGMGSLEVNFGQKEAVCREGQTAAE